MTAHDEDSSRGLERADDSDRASSSSPVAPPLTRMHDRALDGLRGLAIALVLAYHFNVLHQPASFSEALWRGVMNVGWVGVDLFFVLSGFLITAILLDDKARARAPAGYFGRFFARRALRIFPLYYLFLVASFVVLPRLAPHIGSGGIVGVLPNEPAWFWLYVPNLLFARDGAFSGGRHFHLTWSLGVEEQFYVAWPLVVWMLSRVRLRALAAALVVVALLARIAHQSAGATWLTLFVLPWTRMDALAAGAFLATLDDDVWHRRAASRIAMVLVVVGVSYATFMIYWYGQYAQFMPGVTLHGLSVNALAFAGLLFIVRGSPARGLARRVFSLAPLRALGRVAYGLYLSHIFVQHLVVGPLLERDEVVAFFSSRLALQASFSLACTLVSYVVALALFSVFEARFLALRRHFRAPPSDTLDDAARAT